MNYNCRRHLLCSRQAVAPPTEGAAEAAQQLTKIRQQLRYEHAKRKPLLSRCSTDSLINARLTFLR